MDASISDALLSATGRWLGSGDGHWRVPGDTAGLPALLASRARDEDQTAALALSRVAHEAACLLGDSPGALGELAPAWEMAARSCVALGADDRAVRARAHGGLPAAGLAESPTTSYAPDVDLATLLAPALELSVTLHGERLRYRFLAPEALPLLAAARPVIDAADPTTPEALVLCVRSIQWLPSAPPRAPAAMGAADLAAIEQATEAELAGWSAALTALTAEQLAPELRGPVLRWVRTTLYGYLAWDRLARGQPSIAVGLFEEAVGGVPRPRPGPGLDPVLLSGLAQARWQAGEHQRAAELLADLGLEPGWEVAGVAAELVARVAVLPSAAESRVRR